MTQKRQESVYVLFRYPYEIGNPKTNIMVPVSLLVHCMGLPFRISATTDNVAARIHYNLDSFVTMKDHDGINPDIIVTCDENDEAVFHYKAQKDVRSILILDEVRELNYDNLVVFDQIIAPWYDLKKYVTDTFGLSCQHVVWDTWSIPVVRNTRRLPPRLFWMICSGLPEELAFADYAASLLRKNPHLSLIVMLPSFHEYNEINTLIQSFKNQVQIWLYDDLITHDSWLQEADLVVFSDPTAGFVQHAVSSIMSGTAIVCYDHPFIVERLYCDDNEEEDKNHYENAMSYYGAVVKRRNLFDHDDLYEATVKLVEDNFFWTSFDDRKKISFRYDQIGKNRVDFVKKMSLFFHIEEDSDDDSSTV